MRLGLPYAALLLAAAAAAAAADLDEQALAKLSKGDPKAARALYARAAEAEPPSLDSLFALAVAPLSGALATAKAAAAAADLSPLSGAAQQGSVAAHAALGFRALYGLDGAAADCPAAVGHYRAALAAAPPADALWRATPADPASLAPSPTPAAAPEAPVYRVDAGTRREHAAARATGEEVREYWAATAKKGDLRALLELGKMHETGAYGAEVSAAKSLAAYTAAAERGAVAGIAELGLAHLRGTAGTAVDLARAAQLLNQAAQHGSAPAQAALARMQLTGAGVEADTAAAESNLRKAAASDEASALYAFGELVLSEAVVALEGGAGSGAPRHLAFAATSASPRQVAAALGDQDARMALQCFEAAAALGNAAAAERQGWMYEHGIGATASCEAAAVAYKTAAEASAGAPARGAAAAARFKAGDEEGAAAAYWLAAEAGDADAQASLAFLHGARKRLCSGAADCHAKAGRMWALAAAQGDAAATFELGNRAAGSGGDAAGAVALWAEAADVGHAPAVEALALAYEKGYGVPRDTRTAERLTLLQLGGGDKAGGGGGGGTGQARLLARLARLRFKGWLPDALRAAGLKAARLPASADGDAPGAPLDVGVVALVDGDDCLGADGVFRECTGASSSLWATFDGEGGQRLVSLAETVEDAAPKARCLGRTSRNGGASSSVGLVPCADAEAWTVDRADGKLSPDGGRHAVVRLADAARSQMAVRGHTALDALEPAAAVGAEAGRGVRIVAAGANGGAASCFDGTRFAECASDDPSQRWGVFVQSLRNGGELVVFREAVGEGRRGGGARDCLVRKGGRLAVGKCGANAEGWSLAGGELRGDKRRLCVTRGKEGAAAVGKCAGLPKGKGSRVVVHA